MGVTNYYTVNGEILAERAGTGARTDYMRDALGSVTGTTDSSGAIVNTYRYKPYGARLAKTGSGADPSFGWAGTVGCRQTNLSHSSFYMIARHYAKDDGCWTTVDSLWPDERPYSYVRNSPTTLVDPSGHKPSKRPPDWPKDGCWPVQKCPCWKDLPVKDNSYYMNCLQQAVKKHCTVAGVGELGEGGVGNYSNSYFEAIVWCIVQGESGWDPNNCTQIKRGPQKGCLACGLAQITPSLSSTCGSNWRSDPCVNLECGIKNLCTVLRNPDTHGWIYAQRCHQLYNAINENWPSFDNCLKKNFGITLDHRSPLTGKPFVGKK